MKLQNGFEAIRRTRAKLMDVYVVLVNWPPHVLLFSKQM